MTTIQAVKNKGKHGVQSRGSFGQINVCHLRVVDSDSEYEIEQLLHLCLNLFARNAAVLFWGSKHGIPDFVWQGAPHFLVNFDGSGPTKRLVDPALHRG